MAFNNEIEKTKKEIEVLTKKLSFLEELSKTKTPAEIAFKEFYGAYPITDIADTSWDSDGWIYFEAGYNAAQKDYNVGEHQEPIPEEEEEGQETLYDLIADWWDEIFMNNNEAAVTIESLVDDIEKWLPKPQSAAGSQNAYVECSVEGFNDCLTKIKGKLR